MRVRAARTKLLLCLAATLAASAATAAEVWPERAPPPLDTALEARVHSIVANMTLEQKIGQMTQPDIRSVTPEDDRKYYYRTASLILRITMASFFN
jgi:beta-glucosidase